MQRWLARLYPTGTKWKPKVGRFLLDFDARFDSSCSSRALVARALRALLRLHGPLPRRRLAALDLGRADLGGRHASAPAASCSCWRSRCPPFRETSDDDWLKKSELAVTFLDRYGNEIGSRGIKHNDSHALESFPIT